MAAPFRPCGRGAVYVYTFATEPSRAPLGRSGLCEAKSFWIKLLAAQQTLLYAIGIIIASFLVSRDRRGPEVAQCRSRRSPGPPVRTVSSAFAPCRKDPSCGGETGTSCVHQASYTALPELPAHLCAPCAHGIKEEPGARRSQGVGEARTQGNLLKGPAGPFLIGRGCSVAQTGFAGLRSTRKEVPSGKLDRPGSGRNGDVMVSL